VERASLAETRHLSALLIIAVTAAVIAMQQRSGGEPATQERGTSHLRMDRLDVERGAVSKYRASYQYRIEAPGGTWCSLASASSWVGVATNRRCRGPSGAGVLHRRVVRIR